MITLIIRYSEIAPIIDGDVSNIEWMDSDSIYIHRSDDWIIKILTKYDDKNLYVAFTNLETDTNRVISEILFEPNLQADTVWNSNTLWFHASYGDCFKAGGYFDWSTCSKTKTDWSANNLDFKNGNDNMEFQISLSKLMAYNISQTDIFFRIAFDVGDKYDNINLWPDSAVISNPSTWGYAKFQIPEK